MVWRKIYNLRLYFLQYCHLFHRVFNTFTVTGMKPLTRVYPFFDGIDVSAYVTPTGSSAGAALTTDAAGQVSGTFAIPDPETSGAPKWRTGKRFHIFSNKRNIFCSYKWRKCNTYYSISKT